MGAAFNALAELAAKSARTEVDALEHAKAVLLAIVRAKRTGEANPGAWAEAFAIAEAADLETAARPRSKTLRCPRCACILRAPPERVGALKVPNEPRDVECGRSHVFVYDGIRVWLDEEDASWKGEGEAMHTTTSIDAVDT